MSHQKHIRRSSNPHHVSRRNESENGQTQHKSPLPTQPSRPLNNNRDDWRAYWQAHNQPWRTEPEISKERQEELARCRAIPVHIEKGIYPFGGMKLDRADVEWLLETHENGRGPVNWSDGQQRERKGLDLRGANFVGKGGQPINLSGLPLACLNVGYETPVLMLLGDKKFRMRMEERLLKMGNMSMRKANFSKAQLEGANFAGLQLEEVNFSNAYLGRAVFDYALLRRADFEYADAKNSRFHAANLEETYFEGAILENADLGAANLVGADLFNTYLKEANLTGACLGRAYFYRAKLEEVDLRDVVLGDRIGIGPQLVDVQWGNTILSVADWSRVALLGEDYIAKQKKFENGKVKSRKFRLGEYEEAVRANRQLAVALQSQGLNEDAARFAYRANGLQKRVYWYQMFVIETRHHKESTKRRILVKRRLAILAKRVQRFGSYLFSLFLDVLAGYGYKPERTVGWYLLVVFGFALAYALLGHLPFWPDALVYSLTSFHGRGFLPNLDGQTATLHNPLVVMAAFEAVIGLLIEVSFIATFTQRFFGK